MKKTLRFFIFPFALQWITSHACAQVISCQASFSMSFDSTSNQLVVVSNSQIQTPGGPQPPDFYMWDFGDGSTSAQGPTAVHTYTDSGTFSVCLTIGDFAQSCVDSFCQTLTVESVCNLSVQVMAVQFNTWVTSNVIGGTPPYTYTWLNGSTDQSIPVSGNESTYCVTVTDAVGCMANDCELILPGNATLCGTVFSDVSGNGVIDSADAGLVGNYLIVFGQGVQHTVLTDSFGNYSLYGLQPGTYTVMYCLSNNPTFTGGVFTVPVDSASSNCATYQVTINSNQTLCDLNFGVYNNVSVVSGYVFYDSNQNGIMDGSETGISGQVVSMGNYTTATNSSGYYEFYVPDGNHTISLTTTGLWAWSTSGTSPISITTSVGQTYPDNNFPLFLPANIQDLSIDAYPLSTITPGFTAMYSVRVCNNGASVQDAAVSFNYFSALIPQSQSPDGFVNIGSNLITWNVEELQPGECRNMYAYFYTPTNLALGTMCSQSVSVSDINGSDANLQNNSYTLNQTVVGSYDPNNKLPIQSNTVNPTEHLISQYNPNQELRYVVNFQNTGTAPAHNVVVVDEISEHLDMSSFRFLASRHPNVEIIISGRTISYKFMNIMLPDSTTDEPNSHGFISYMINALPEVPVNTEITDFANIYFDFNEPILTDDAVVLMVAPIGMASIKEEGFSVFPNPVADILEFNTQAFSSGSFKIVNALGQTLIHESFSNGKGNLSVANLPKGLYTLTLETFDVVQTYHVRFVKK